MSDLWEIPPAFVNGRLVYGGKPTAKLLARRRSAQQVALQNTPRCGATRRSDGQPCRAFVAHDGARCKHHAGAAKQRRALNRRGAKVAVSRLRQGTASPEYLRRREVRRLLQKAWRKDPWYPGSTVELQPRHERSLIQHLEALTGRSVEQLPAAVVDWCRWKWQLVVVDGRGCRLTSWRGGERECLLLLQRELPERLRNAGPRPAPIETD